MDHQFGSGRLKKNNNSEEEDIDGDQDPSKQSTTRSYIDMMREEESSGTAYRDLIHSKSGNKNRRSFNDRFRLSRNSSSTGTTTVPASDITFGSRRFDPSAAYPGDDYVVECDGEVCVRVSSSRVAHPSRPPTARIVVEDLDESQQQEQSSSSSPSEEDHDRMTSKPAMPSNPRGMFSRSSSVAVSRTAEEEEEVVAAAPAKVSLMDLLMEEKGGADGAAFFLGIFGGGDEGGEESEEEEEEEEEREEDGEEHDCGVCMVRHRGAASAPCGHTYCRLCSRELWVSKGNCPLCNGYIVEILDIF